MEGAIALLRSMGLKVEFDEEMAKQCSPELSRRTREALDNVERSKRVTDLRQCGR